MFEELLKEIKDTLENTKYIVVVPVPHKKLWEELCNTLEGTKFAFFTGDWETVKHRYWEDYKEETVMCFRRHNAVHLSYSYRSYHSFNNNKEFKFLEIPLNTPKCLRRL